MNILNTFEKKFNFKLPQKYKMLMLSGEINSFKNICILTNEGEEFFILQFLTSEQICTTHKKHFFYGGCDLIPIAELEYGDFICLDFSENQDKPKVVFWNYEYTLEEEKNVTEILFNSFDEFYGVIKDEIK